MKQCSINVSFLLVSLLLNGCIKDRCPLTEGNLRMMQICPLWPEGCQEPTGIRVFFYSFTYQKYVLDNYPPEGGSISIRQGKYALIMYNTDSETIFFRNAPDYSTHEAYTKRINRPSYVSPVPDEEGYEQPDILWEADIDAYDVDQTTSIIYLHPQQLVKEYSGTIAVEGLGPVKAVRGAVTGMMSSCFLKSKQCGTKSASVFFDIDKGLDSIYFKFRSFGIYQEDMSRKHFLTLEFLLSNGIARKNIDLTEQLNRLMDGGKLLIDKTIVIPPDSTDSDGGFDTDVGKWDEIIYPIPI